MTFFSLMPRSYKIPIIDLAPLTIGRKDGLKQIARDIVHACRTTGFFYIVNHGVPEALVTEIFAQARRFFAQPQAVKQLLDIRRSPHMRGYFGIGDEQPEYESLGDLKEGFDMGLDLPPNDPDVRAGIPLYGPNVWPEWPEFRETSTAYYSHVWNLGLQLLRIFAHGLGLDEEFFTAKFAKPMAQLRMLHYPPQRGPVTHQQMGAGEHTDFGCVTILAQDSVGGLEARNELGSWFPVPPLRGSFVVNIGDLMMRWTNDFFPATLHRVINTNDRDRYSIVYFLDPNWDAEIKCLDVCCSDKRPARYTPVTGGEYMQSKLDATFAFRGQQQSQASH